jgi:tellurite resistance protein
LRANLFGLPFGLCGLAQCWSVAAAVAGVPTWPAVTLWVLAGLAWTITGLAYVANVVTTGRLRTELSDTVFAPFTALIVIVPMLLGVALAQIQPGAGAAVFLIGLVLTVLLGGWLLGGWILQDMTLAQWHPGYFLPTVAGGLIAAGGSASLGYGALSMLMFGYGAVCWLVLGSILLLRLFTQPALPTPLLPTMAIELAPPVVAGSAWFVINDHRPDSIAFALAGYGILMALVQFRLIPAFRRVPFGPGAWAFSFSYAAAFTLAIHWLAALQVDQQVPLTYALLTLITLAIGVLSLATIRGLAHNTYLPRAGGASSPQSTAHTSRPVREGPDGALGRR